MPRKALRTSDAAALHSASKRSPSPGSPPAPKRAKRQSSSTASKAAPTKSKYFSATEDEFSDPASASEPESAVEKEESGYEDEDEDASATSPSASEEEDDAAEYSSEEEESKSKKRGRPSKANAAPNTKTVGNGAKGEELWRPGVKTGLGPGTQVVIKKPKAREAGSTPYTDDTIHPNTMLFLGDLKANNDREWLKSEHPGFMSRYIKRLYSSCTCVFEQWATLIEGLLLLVQTILQLVKSKGNTQRSTIANERSNAVHDPDYRASLKDFNSFLECLTQKIIEADETVPELPVKDIVCTPDN